MKLPDKARLFDALFDESEFASALDDIAGIIGARSYVGGFAFHDGMRALNIANTYFAPEHIDEYYRTFFEEDPWVRHLLAHWKPGVMVDPGRHLTTREIEWSGLYQNFFRPLGDDTFHVLGVTTQTEYGIGSMSFQQGRGSGYSDRAKDALSSIAPDLARVMSLRGRLQGMERDIVERSSALDAIGDGMILLDAQGCILMANAAAESRLRQGDLIRSEKGRLACRTVRNGKALAATLEALGELRHTGLRLEAADGASLDMTFLALPPAGGRARTLVAFPSAPEPTRSDVLRRLYGLSASEADITVMLTDGLDPADIAEARGTSLNTVRVQLRTVGEKMGCSRLIDIVRRVAALPRIGDAPAA